MCLFPPTPSPTVSVQSPPTLSPNKEIVPTGHPTIGPTSSKTCFNEVTYVDKKGKTKTCSSLKKSDEKKRLKKCKEGTASSSCKVSVVKRELLNFVTSMIYLIPSHQYQRYHSYIVRDCVYERRSRTRNQTKGRMLEDLEYDTPIGPMKIQVTASTFGNEIFVYSNSLSVQYDT